MQTKAFRVLSCVNYIIVENCVGIDYLSCQSKQLSEICIDTKYMLKRFNKLLGIGIPYLSMKLLPCRGFMKNINVIVILLCPSRMLEYCFSKGFVILKHNSVNLSINTNNSKQVIHAIHMHDSEYVMICTTEISYISNTLKNLLIPSDFHSYYI